MFLPESDEMRLLLVEDDSMIGETVRLGLRKDGFTVDWIRDGESARTALSSENYDIVVLDLGLPRVDGLDLLRHLRSMNGPRGRVPVLVVTARDAVPDRVTGLDAGADDYLVKPFDFDELLARVRALLRRTQTAAEARHEELRFADLVLDIGARTIHRDGREIELTPREFDLLALFMRNPNQVLTRSTLMQRVWGEDFFGESNVLEVVIGNLRRALESGGEDRLIQTVRGVGYVLRQR